MSEARKDADRALIAAKAIFDGRDVVEASSVMVTLEHAVTTVLLALHPDPAKAAGMLNEGLVPGVEERLSRYLATTKGGD